MFYTCLWVICPSFWQYSTLCWIIMLSFLQKPTSPVSSDITSNSPAVRQNTERHRRQITTKLTAENVKSSCLIHLAHVFFSCVSESAERKTHFACHSFLMSFWVYIFLSGLYSLITASSSGFWRQTSKVPFPPFSLLLPSGLPPFL